MIVLLSYSTNSLASNDAIIPSTGGLASDSVLISYDDLRKVNAKLVELEYEKEINKNLRSIISNDSIAITDLNNTIINNDAIANKKLKDVRKQRNIAGGIGVGAIILLIISLL